ncbi:hypothetical protein [Streptomyces sp. NPDC001933]|uniref:hypothetical protein n=1 Tax=Streptomyces sp. NPDC001933 TaxID=3364626 RepID=UPI0036748C1D
MTAAQPRRAAATLHDETRPTENEYAVIGRAEGSGYQVWSVERTPADPDTRQQFLEELSNDAEDQWGGVSTVYATSPQEAEERIRHEQARIAGLAPDQETHMPAKTTDPDITPEHLLTPATPAIVAVITTPEHFEALRTYDILPFTDHTTYLTHIENLLRAHTARGQHTIAVLFDPEEYTDYCDEGNIDPAAPTSQGRYTAEAAATGTRLTYHGQDIAHLTNELHAQADQDDSYECARRILDLADLGPCPDCGDSSARTGHALEKAMRLLIAILDRAGTGTHKVTTCIDAFGEKLIACVNAEQSTVDTPVRINEHEALQVAAILAAGIATHTTGGVILCTSTPDAPDRVFGWRLEHGDLTQPTAGEVFLAFGTAPTDNDTSDTEYRPGYNLTPGSEWPTHH